jgi:hypothetical protein
LRWIFDARRTNERRKCLTGLAAQEQAGTKQQWRKRFKSSHHGLS